MQAKQSTKCSQSYEYKYLKEYILNLQECALEFWVKWSPTVHIIFLGELKAEGKKSSSSTVGLTKNDQKQEGNF